MIARILHRLVVLGNVGISLRACNEYDFGSMMQKKEYMQENFPCSTKLPGVQRPITDPCTNKKSIGSTMELF